MSVTRWANVTGDAQVAGNWSNGVPTDTNDEIHITEGSVSLTNTDLRTVLDVDPKTLIVGGSFVGNIGSDSVALKLADFDAYPDGEARVDLDGPPTQIINLDLLTCPTVVVMNSGTGQYACFFSAGTLTDLFIFGGRSIRIGAGATVTNLRIASTIGRPVPTVHIESGATISNLYASAGEIRSSAALAAVRLTGTAQLYQEGSSTTNITTLTALGGSKAWLRGVGGTVTNYETMDGAVIDSDTGSTRAWTYTNAGTLSGGILRAKSMDIFTNQPKEAGGRLLYSGARKVILTSP